MSQTDKSGSKSKRSRSSKDGEAADHTNDTANGESTSHLGHDKPSKELSSDELEQTFGFKADADDERPKKRRKPNESAPRVLQHPFHCWKKLASESRSVIGDKIFLKDLTLSDPKNSNNKVKIAPGSSVTTRIGRVDTSNLVVFGVAMVNLGKKLVVFVNPADQMKEPAPYAVDVEALVAVVPNDTWDSHISDSWLESLRHEHNERSDLQVTRSSRHTPQRRTISGLTPHELSQLVQAIVTPIVSDFSKQFRSVIAEIHEKDENHQKFIMEEFKALWAANSQMTVDLISLLNNRHRANDQ